FGVDRGHPAGDRQLIGAVAAQGVVDRDDDAVGSVPVSPLLQGAVLRLAWIIGRPCVDGPDALAPQPAQFVEGLRQGGAGAEIAGGLKAVLVVGEAQTARGAGQRRFVTGWGELPDALHPGRRHAADASAQGVVLVVYGLAVDRLGDRPAHDVAGVGKLYRSIARAPHPAGRVVLELDSGPAVDPLDHRAPHDVAD